MRPQGFALRGRVHSDWDEYAEHTIFFARRSATGEFSREVFICAVITALSRVRDSSFTFDLWLKV